MVGIPAMIALLTCSLVGILSVRPGQVVVRSDPFLKVLVLTGGPNSPVRIRRINDTWAKDLEPGSLHLLEHDSECKDQWGDDQWQGLACRQAKGLLRLMDRSEFKWLLVVDDDTYVFPARVRDTLRAMDASQRQVYGCPGCGDCAEGRQGLCGGCGYMISRQNLVRMVTHRGGVRMHQFVDDRTKEEFVGHYMQKPMNQWSDVRMGCVAQDAGLNLVKVRGLHGWKEEAKWEADQVALKQGSPPLEFHPVRSTEHMDRLRLDFVEEQQRDHLEVHPYSAENWTSSSLADTSNSRTEGLDSDEGPLLTIPMGLFGH